MTAPIVLVALLVSAWIEIFKLQNAELGENVALLVSAWIEIVQEGVSQISQLVALLVSAWIEMLILHPVE